MRGVPSDDRLSVAMSTTRTRPIEPLFADPTRLWLRVWVAPQAVAVVFATAVAIARAGGVGAFLRAPTAPRAVLTLAALVAYHALGLRARAWILRRPWAVLAFVV